MKTNTEIVTDIYAAFAKGDIPFILSSIDEDFSWTDPSNPEIAPQGGTYYGRNGMSEFFKNLAGSVDTTLWEVENYFSAGDTVVAIGKHGVTVKSTGKSVVLPWIMIWDFKDGMPKKGRSSFDAKKYETFFLMK